MSQKLSAYLFSCIIVSMSPLQAVAQQTQQQPAQQPPQWYGPGPWQMMWYDGYGWQFWWICLLMMLFMIVVIGCVFFIVRSRLSDSLHHWESSWRGASHSALQILNERFARGEIQKAEYEERKVAILSGG